MYSYSPSSAQSRSASRLERERVAENRNPTPEPNPNARRRSNELEDKFTRACRQKGRWINVAICFGIDLQEVFKTGIHSDLQELGVGNSGDDDRNISAEEEEQLLAAYQGILKLIPKLKNILTYQPNADADYLTGVIEAIQEGSNAARSEAIKRVKDNTSRYLKAGTTPIIVDDTQIQHKALRGFNDSKIGRLLIPAEDLHEWDADPDGTRAGYIAGLFTVWGSDMPVFLYEDYRCDPEEPEQGLFRGSFLVYVLLDILYGSNSVDTKNVKREEQPRHHCLGEMYGLVTISPENIAYAAVVARFCLSSKRVWSIKDENFNYRTFYQAIVLSLVDNEDPWVQETLAWWNMYVIFEIDGELFDCHSRLCVWKRAWQSSGRRRD